MRRLVMLATVACLALQAAPGRASGVEAHVDPFRGLGTWVDVFDYAPRLQPDGAEPRVTPASVDVMASLGVRTLYLQVANPDDAPPSSLTDASLVRQFVSRVHDRGMRVVAWYLPTLDDVARDVAMMRAIHALRAGSDHFDGYGLDIEYTEGVADVQVRNRRAVSVARQVRKLVGATTPLSAIVYPAVQLEVVNPVLWPGFPYRKLAPYFDAWQPMAYYTFRSTDSGYRDAHRYTKESVDRLRKRLGSSDVPVHVVGGIADASTPADTIAFRRAARKVRAVGYSLYDFATTPSTAWTELR